jgi:hypothetical protein
VPRIVDHIVLPAITRIGEVRGPAGEADQVPGIPQSRLAV